MARLFDNALSQYLEIDQAIVADYPFTLACWFNVDSAASGQTLMAITDKDVGDQIHTFFLSSDQTVRYGVNDPAWAVAITSTTWSLDTWHHACAVGAASNSRSVYLDGGGKATSMDTRDPSGMDRFSIGRNGDSTPSSYMSGATAEVAIWDVALTDAEVAILALKYSPLLVRPGDLVFYMPLIRDRDFDIVGGVSLTAFNTPTIAAHSPVYYPSARHISHISAAAPPAVNPIFMQRQRIKTYLRM